MNNNKKTHITKNLNNNIINKNNYNKDSNNI
jgi:hypothetical protein